MGPVVILALLSSVFYGASDFLGALSSRRMSVITASVVIYSSAILAICLAFPIVDSTWSVQALRAGVFAGVFAVVGMVTFYAALAIGPMSLLAPVIALIQTAVPVIVAAATGQTLSVMAWIAVGIALVATTMISVPTGGAVTRISRRGGILAVVSGVTLGFSMVFLDLAPSDSGVIPVFLDVAAGLTILLPFVAFARFRRGDGWLKGAAVTESTPLNVTARTWAMTIVGGVLLGVGNVLLIVALHAGNLAVVAVLVSLYPLATVLLAWAVLKERIGMAQLFGVLFAITAAVMLGVS